MLADPLVDVIPPLLYKLFINSGFLQDHSVSVKNSIELIVSALLGDILERTYYWKHLVEELLITLHFHLLFIKFNHTT